jgi:hypothetical protein
MWYDTAVTAEDPGCCISLRIKSLNKKMVVGKKEDADVRVLRCLAVLVALTAALLFRQLSKNWTSKTRQMVFKNEGGVRRNRFTCSLFVGVSWHAVSLREYGMYVCLEVLLVHSTCDVAHLHIRLKTIYWTCALLQPIISLPE